VRTTSPLREVEGTVNVAPSGARSSESSAGRPFFFRQEAAWIERTCTACSAWRAPRGGHRERAAVVPVALGGMLRHGRSSGTTRMGRSRRCSSTRPSAPATGNLLQGLGVISGCVRQQGLQAETVAFGRRSDLSSFFSVWRRLAASAWHAAEAREGTRFVPGDAALGDRWVPPSALGNGCSSEQPACGGVSSLRRSPRTGPMLDVAWATRVPDEPALVRTARSPGWNAAARAITPNRL
jgi:hypothetical protein